MSYILDALKKSEQERGKQEQIPTLATVHRPVSHQYGRTTRRTGLVLALALVVALGSLGSYLWLRPLPGTDTGQQEAGQAELATVAADQPQVPATPLAISEPASTQAGVQAEPAPPPRPALHATAQSPPPLPQVSQGAQPPATTLVPKVAYPPARAVDTLPVPAALPFLHELDGAIQDGLPELSFAGHTYAADRTRRLILINSQIRREGEFIAPGLRLVEITWDGVVLEQRGLRFQVRTDR